MRLTVWTVDRLCSQVNLRLKRPRIDLTAVTLLSPYALVYLGMFLRRHNARGKGFDVGLPRNRKARQYLQRQKFFERFDFDTAGMVEESIDSLGASTALDDIIDVPAREDIGNEVTVPILNVLRSNKVDIDTSRFAEFASELVDNFAQHAEHPLAAVAMQYYPGERRVALAVGDCGVGVRASLAGTVKYAYLRNRSHTEAILKALEPQVSRKWEGGMGLTDATTGVLDMGGQLTIASGDAIAIMDEQGARAGKKSHSLTGVQIEVSVPEREH